MQKNYLILILLLIAFNFSYAQEIQFPPSIISLGGGSIDDSDNHISKWRIGKIHVLQINGAVNEETDWKTLVYPNPVDDLLNVEFKIDSPSTFEISIYDITGRNLFIRENLKIKPNETIQINLSGFASAIYYVNVKSNDLSINNTLKIFKY